MFAIKSLVFAALTFASFSNAANVTVLQVGPSGGLVFNPNSIIAAVGDILTFQWNGAPGNHSVTQSSFAAPCDPLTNGFDSGFIYTPPGITTGFPEWNLTITNASAPIWFFCKQSIGDHCKAGMVGAVNAPTTGNTFAKFQAAAAAFSSTPGQTEGGLAGVGASASAPPAPLTGSVTGYGVPTGAAAPAGTTATTTAKPTSTGAASTHGANALLALLGITFAFTLA